MNQNEIRSNGYTVQSKLGENFSGMVRLVDGTKAQVTFGFSNAGFRGIEFYDANTKTHHNAGEIVRYLRSDGWVAIRKEATR